MPSTPSAPESKQLWPYAIEIAISHEPSTLDDICCGRNFTPKVNTDKVQETPERSIPSSGKKKPPYTPVLPYGEMAEALRKYQRGTQEVTAPEYMHNRLDELAEAMEYAAVKVEDGTVCDRDSERSHFKNVWMAKRYASEAERPGEPLENRLFLMTLSKSLVDAWDVLEGNEDPQEKENLYDNAIRGLNSILNLTPDSPLLRHVRSLDKEDTCPRLPGR